MRNLMKFGIVLVVLAMVVSGAFAKDNKSGDSGSWCDPDTWGREVPYYDDGDKVRISDGEHIVVDAVCPDGEDPGADNVELRGNSSLTVGTADVEVRLVFRKDLRMSDDKSGDFTTLDIVNGRLTVEDQCKDLAEDGDIHIIVAAGSKLTFEDGVYLGDSNGSNSVYIFDIAGDFKIDGDRFEHRGGQLIVNQTGGEFVVKKTSRLSDADDAVATFNISGGTVELDKVELNNEADDFDYSLEINLSGDGEWDGGGEELKDNDDGVIVNINITGTASFVTKDLNINNSDSEIHITMDSGTFDIEDDIDMEAGDIVITGGVFNVEDDFELGDGDSKATMTVSGTAEVWIDDLYMANKSELTIIGCRVDIDDLKEMKSGSVIDIIIGGSLVIKNADDSDDWDDIKELIDDDQIITSGPGEIIWDYDVTNSDRLTIQVVYPFEADLKPGGCPNPLRIGITGNGVFPVAIVGSATFDVTTINLDTITLIGVPVHRAKVGDVSTADAECNPDLLGPDGTSDLILKFRRTEVIAALEGLYGDLTIIPNRSSLRLVLFAETIGGDPVGGVDTLVVLNRGGIKTKKKVGGSKK